MTTPMRAAPRLGHRGIVRMYGRVHINASIYMLDTAVESCNRGVSTCSTPVNRRGRKAASAAIASEEVTSIATRWLSA